MFTGRVKAAISCVVLALVGTTSLAACGSDSGKTADGLTKVKVATTVTGPTYWPFYYTPELLGFYEEEGLSVEVISINSGVTQSLLSGQIDIGGAGFDYMQQAGNVDGLRWYMMTDRHIFTPVVLGSSPIQSVSELAGKKIGINEPNDSFDADFVLAANGVKLDDYELVPVGEAAPAAKALAAGEVDALIIPASSSYLNAVDAVDEELRMLDAPVSESFYNTGLMATEDFLKENREVAVKFGRAIAKAIIWLNENPEATAEMILEMVPEAAPDLKQALRQVNVAVDWNTEIYAQKGKIDTDVFASEVDALLKAKLIEEAYDPAKVYDLTLYDDIWDFDVDEVVAQAKEGNWKDAGGND